MILKSEALVHLHLGLGLGLLLAPAPALRLPLALAHGHVHLWRRRSHEAVVKAQVFEVLARDQKMTYLRGGILLYLNDDRISLVLK